MLEDSTLITESVPDEKLCCLCGSPIKGEGNNPYPLNSTPGARCCDKCNLDVINARIKMIKSSSDLPFCEGYVAPEKKLKKKVFNNRRGTVEHASNEKRLEREAYYRNLLSLDEDFEITEDNLEPWAITRTANIKSCPEERIRCELLKQPYTGYEEY